METTERMTRREARERRQAMRGWQGVRIERTDDGQYVITGRTPGHTSTSDRLTLRADGTMR